MGTKSKNTNFVMSSFMRESKIKTILIQYVNELVQ